MALSLHIELTDHDLEYFQQAMAAAKQAVGQRSAEEIIEAAGKLLAQAQQTRVPDFILQRLLRLDDMIAMLRDEGWALPEEDRQRVLSALAYFCDPKDVIPDDVAVLGFLDDAIMIELCVRELKHELDAYDDFCDFRQQEAERRGLAPETVGHADWLDSRRNELIDRMHRRRARDYGTGYGSSSGYAGGRRTYVRAWRPGMFRFA